MSACDALLGEQLEALGEVHAQEARVARRPRRANSSKRSSAAGSRSMQTSVPVGPMRSGDQARVAAVAEGAVDRGLARRRIEQVDQLAGQDRYVRACHVKKDGQGSQRSPTISSVELLLIRPPAPCDPRPRGGRGCRRSRPPSRSPRARAAAAFSVTRPAESSSTSKELPAKKRVSLRRSRLTGFSFDRKQSVQLLELLRRPDRDAGLEPLRENEAVERTPRGTWAAR